MFILNKQFLNVKDRAGGKRALKHRINQKESNTSKPRKENPLTRQRERVRKMCERNGKKELPVMSLRLPTTER